MMVEGEEGLESDGLMRWQAVGIAMSSAPGDRVNYPGCPHVPLLIMSNSIVSRNDEVSHHATAGHAYETV